MAENNKDDGGQAYPRSYAYSARTPAMAELVSVKGMTLLDHFASKAISHPEVNRFGIGEQFAKASYDMAEAMIAEKRKREES